MAARRDWVVAVVTEETAPMVIRQKLAATAETVAREGTVLLVVLAAQVA